MPPISSIQANAFAWTATPEKSQGSTKSDVLEKLSNFLTGLMDILLGWLLRLPSDVQIIAVAAGSAIILALVRRWTTDQDLLRRCRNDKARLKILVREAKDRKDDASVKRHRATLGLIAMKEFRQEGRPLLASLIPIALLATWAFNRLEFHPPAAGQPVEFAAYFPISAAGRLAHIAPADGVHAETGWIQEINAVTDDGGAHGLAKWRITADAGAGPRHLRVRFDSRTYDHPLRVGGPTVEPPLKKHDEHLLVTELKLQQAKLFGVVPGIPSLLFAPWLVAYLLIVIPSAFLVKKLLRIC
jgi:uncharacterized membrane protein (DUF106 family)